MSTSNQVEFAIAPPSLRRAIALGASFFFVLPVVWLAWKVGLSRFLEAPVGWLLCCMYVLPAVLFFRLAFPPRSAMARLRVGHEGISFIPGRWVRRYFAQPVVEVAIPQQATDILLRQKGLSEGYAVVIRSAGEHIAEVYAGASLTMHSSKEIRMLSEGIAGATGLPVHAVRCRRLSDGTTEEYPWIEPNQNRSIWSALILAQSVLPFVAGALVAYLFTSTTAVLAIGVALLIIQIFLPRSKKFNETQIATRVATTLVVSGSAYALAYVLTAHFVGHL